MRTMIEAGFKIGLYIYVSTDSVYEVSEANFTQQSIDKIESDEDFILSDEISSDDSSSDSEEEKHPLDGLIIN